MFRLLTITLYRLRRLRASEPQYPAGESGFAMVEVVVSAALLVVVALGLYSGIDGAAGVSGLNKSRSVAANLVQQDLDRMRAMRVSELGTYDPPATTKRVPAAAGVLYTIVSKGEWINDATGTAGTSACAAGGRTDYVRITSTITWPNMGGVAPVTAQSLVPVTSGSYGTRGNLAVRITTQAAAPVPSQAVTVTGPGGTTRSATTNSVGCAFFAYLDAGTYTISYARANYVTTAGSSAESATAVVNPGATANKDLLYDLAGQIRASFDTRRMAFAAGTFSTVPAPASDVYVEKNQGAPSGASVPIGVWSTGTPATAFTTPAAFYPFPTAYSLYAGTCTSNKPPSPPTPPPSYTATVTPGASPANSSVVRVPAINVEVRNANTNAFVTNTANTAIAGARVRIMPRTLTGCVGAVPTSTKYPSQLTLAGSAATGPKGSLPNPGYPYGTYAICAEINYGAAGTTNNIYSVTTSNFNSTLNTGTGLQTLSVRSSVGSGTVKAACP